LVHVQWASSSFVQSRLNLNAAGDRQCIAWAKSHLLLAVSQDVNVDVGPRRDKRNSTQVYVSMGIGATRMEEVGVVSILSDPTLV